MRSAQIDMLTDEGVTVPDGALELAQAVLQTLAEETGSFGADILLTNEDEIQRLNREFRQVDAVTDVLSFPSGEEPFRGDIAICVSRALDQAQEIGNTPQREIAFLALHGALHLLGYDHETEADEEKMLAMQRAIMERALQRT